MGEGKPEVNRFKIKRNSTYIGFLKPDGAPARSLAVPET